MNALSIPPLRRMRPMLGTYVEVAAEGDCAVVAIGKAFAAIEAVQHTLSFHSPDSELSRLNSSRGRWQALSPLAIQVLRLARGMTVASDHRFNCTVGGELIARGALPDHGGEYLPRGSAEDIEIEGRQARLRRPVRVTLDGIAKGYAVDSAVKSLQRAGIRAGWVNAGGDLRVFGDRPLPVSQRRPDGSLRSLGALHNAALATSQLGAAELLPGLIISDTQQGEEPPSVFSVIARSAWRADALTKVAATSVAAERRSYVDSLGGWLVPEVVGESD